ncbi:hypothetical protein ACJIZ3_024272 [Penstemon smallii]|uniref:Uncharacterized protein n=1 Tax=Penstemon smallii TaxID=265156 RepID=A0ABD3TSQ3_9LAMI
MKTIKLFLLALSSTKFLSPVESLFVLSSSPKEFLSPAVRDVLPYQVITYFFSLKLQLVKPSREETKLDFSLFCFSLYNHFMCDLFFIADFLLRLCKSASSFRVLYPIAISALYEVGQKIRGILTFQEMGPKIGECLYLVAQKQVGVINFSIEWWWKISCF